MRLQIRSCKKLGRPNPYFPFANLLIERLTSKKQAFVMVNRRIKPQKLLRKAERKEFSSLFPAFFRNFSTGANALPSPDYNIKAIFIAE